MAASEWPECRFIGLDCVPLFPDLSRINSGLAKRVQYVNGNFLEQPLPFPSEFFDYVHVKHIAKGVPEDKWDLIFEEISRVLVPGGAVEVTEEDILFPRARLPASKKRPIMQRQHRSPSLPPPTQTNNPAPPYDIRQRTISSPLAPPTSDKFSYLYQNSSPISAHSELTIERAQPKWSNSREQSPSSPHTYSPLFSGDEYVPESVDPTFSPITQYSSSPPKHPTTFQLRPRPSLPSFYSSPQSAPTILPIVLADDELLERLYLSVYDRRRINLRPTSFIGNLLPIHFKKTSASPHICQYMSSTRSTKRNAGAVTNVPKTNMKGAGRYKPPGSKLEGLQQRPHTSTIIEEGSIDDAWDDIMRKVGMILRQEETMVLQIHRTISDIVACKEAMWEELMIMNGWSDFDFDSPGKARLIRQERSKFDEIVEKYRINLQSRYPFRHVVESKLHWKAPKEEPKTNQKSRTAFSDSEIDDEHEESDFTEDEGPQEDGNNDVEHGILFRRMRIFCAFKADLE
ncbi:hypothetical protein FRC02_010374 [Tulasnella sp. 418]|nr:hypothetical protein FRC02_010374 [Tulasnella sp. 418]